MTADFIPSTMKTWFFTLATARLPMLALIIPLSAPACLLASLRAAGIPFRFAL
jgi:hypothetical protein